MQRLDGWSVRREGSFSADGKSALGSSGQGNVALAPAVGQDEARAPGQRVKPRSLRFRARPALFARASVTAFRSTKITVYTIELENKRPHVKSVIIREAERREENTLERWLPLGLAFAPILCVVAQL